MEAKPDQNPNQQNSNELAQLPQDPAETGESGEPAPDDIVVDAGTITTRGIAESRQNQEAPPPTVDGVLGGKGEHPDDQSSSPGAEAWKHDEDEGTFNPPTAPPPTLGK